MRDLLFSFFLICLTLAPLAAAHASPSPSPTLPLSMQVWAHDGGEKVMKHELRAAQGESTRSLTWDGEKISLFGAKNETVSFELILEADKTPLEHVSVTLSPLKGPDGSPGIESRKITFPSELLSWVNRPIELFYVRYLPVKGLSLLSYSHYDERHIPKSLRRPYVGPGMGKGEWKDRPGADKLYPDILVPLELEKEFSIPLGENQAIWGDIFIPPSLTHSELHGEISITKGTQTLRTIPLTLSVGKFSLPQEPSAKTMVFLSPPDVARRYQGKDESNREFFSQVMDRHFQLAHRHRLSVITESYASESEDGDEPPPQWKARLSGKLFTPTMGYSGPGEGVGNDVYSIGTYGSWKWNRTDKFDVQAHARKWDKWFDVNAPKAERFVYLADESADYPSLKNWSSWISDATNGRLKTFATVPIRTAAEKVPKLSIIASWAKIGDASGIQPLVEQIQNEGREFYLYNGTRPATGSFAVEDEGVALRVLAWSQFKLKIRRWFYWAMNYYLNYQGKGGETSLYWFSHTFGSTLKTDPVLGETGWNYSNGDGVLVYPGMDKVFPRDSYNLPMPFPSVRLKMWRRGLYDVDYLTLASQKAPERVRAIVERMLPKMVWEYGVSALHDPTWYRGDISWSINADDWEQARRELWEILQHS